MLLWCIIVGAGLFIFGYFVGANNPWPSVKRKLLDDAQKAIGKATQQPKL